MGDGRNSRLGAVLLVALVAVASAGIVLWPTGDGDTAVAARRVTIEPKAPPTPLEQVEALLEAQVDALVKGDEKGWLAPVDTKLQQRYRAIFRNLRALEISYTKLTIEQLPPTAGWMNVGFQLDYCFSTQLCRDGGGNPNVGYKLTWKPRGGSYVITGMAGSGKENYLQPAPWEYTQLAFATGRRVIVAAPPAQRKHLNRVLQVAEKAAAVADRYAGYTGNPQARYRVYLADNKSWNSWYGGKYPAWSVAYQLPLGRVGGDVVVRISEMPSSNKELTTIIQHELAHVVTRASSTNYDEEKDLWLIEGIAEYIGFLPAKPGATYNKDLLSYSFGQRGDLKTVVVKPLTAKSDDLTVATLYATGHFAAGCMAAKYGDKKLLDFVDRVVQLGEELDPASRAAFGTPFKNVDKACVSWIKQRT
ncbi:hypothetical protein FHR83_007589 [Actinoplanes campanulatus]|uniref:Peptidase MA superfamily protein n=1 Tax=Actinoplanes campanulatus TaxID=113559 RepID=A0A7W5AP52_9ACTN|nr:hypothetical protein [Actinoplanes campanulatus]MBB3099873.1 hypothetical protein [Actinoplanes campanulatus]